MLVKWQMDDININKSNSTAGAVQVEAIGMNSLVIIYILEIQNVKIYGI